MKIAIVSGSHRKNSESHRIAKYAESRLQKINKVQTHIISLEENPLPLWDESIWTDNKPHWDEKWSPIAKELQSSDGLVVVVPEWGGMVPSGLKNFFLLCTNKELGHKPGLIVSVSSTRNGAYPISELRMSSTKNNRLVYIPDHIIVRNAPQMFVSDQPQDADEQYLRNRFDYSLKILEEYANALKLVRNSPTIDYKNYGSGM